MIQIERGLARVEPHSEFSLDELRKELEVLESGATGGLRDEQLLLKIRALHDGFQIITPLLPAGTGFYRAVRVSQRPTEKSRVSYAPPEFIKKNGRLNRAGEPMFYGAFSLFTGLMECGCKVGEFFAVSGWLTNHAMAFNHLGYSSETLKAHNSGRELPDFAKEKPEPERNRILREWQARVFTQHVPEWQEELYRLPIALKDFAMTAIRQPDLTAPQRFSGVMYPSVAMHLFSDNVAILPSEVDAYLDLFEVVLLTVDGIDQSTDQEGKTQTNTRLKPYDYARPDPHGKLMWGQKSQIVLAEGVDASHFPPTLLPPD
jgi:hypothetical protein